MSNQLAPALLGSDVARQRPSWQVPLTQAAPLTTLLQRPCLHRVPCFAFLHVPFLHRWHTPHASLHPRPAPARARRRWLKSPHIPLKVATTACRRVRDSLRDRSRESKSSASMRVRPLPSAVEDRSAKYSEPRDRCEHVCAPDVTGYAQHLGLYQTPAISLPCESDRQARAS
jgi:hypothetical protein